ncbi:hypothetical protein H0H87_000934 [Tephrocybe sp. NHM501043]|nr:hypothetical protein H0H87_000934 [Tephrocybe sp. NHM501043]
MVTASASIKKAFGALKSKVKAAIHTKKKACTCNKASLYYFLYNIAQTHKSIAADTEGSATEPEVEEDDKGELSMY